MFVLCILVAAIIYLCEWVQFDVDPDWYLDLADLNVLFDIKFINFQAKILNIEYRQAVVTCDVLWNCFATQNNWWHHFEEVLTDIDL